MKITATPTPADAHEGFESAKKAVLDAYENFLDVKKHLRKADVRAYPASSAGIAFLGGIILSRLFGK